MSEDYAPDLDLTEGPLAVDPPPQSAISAFESIPNEALFGIIDNITTYEDLSSTGRVSHSFARATVEAWRRLKDGIIDLRGTRTLPTINPVSASCPYMTDDRALSHRSLMILVDGEEMTHSAGPDTLSIFNTAGPATADPILVDGVTHDSAMPPRPESQIATSRLMKGGDLASVLVSSGNQSLTDNPAVVALLARMKAKTLVQYRSFPFVNTEDAPMMSVEKGAARCLEGKYEKVFQILDPQNAAAGALPYVLAEHVYEGGPELTLLVASDSKSLMTAAARQTAELLDWTQATGQNVRLFVKASSRLRDTAIEATPGWQVRAFLAARHALGSAEYVDCDRRLSVGDPGAQRGQAAEVLRLFAAQNEYTAQKRERTGFVPQREEISMDAFRHVE